MVEAVASQEVGLEKAIEDMETQLETVIKVIDDLQAGQKKIQQN